VSVENSAVNDARAAARGAIFLSYASQDATAAKRICEALRMAGVEVWFDVEGGLETGDEWDAKIRRQIKECVLFLPLISANTQAREEGYFRIEWELAAQRALGIASGVPFILPVVIDATREPEALVPDRFRAVQWTRLPGGEVTPEVKARLLKLWSHRVGLAKHQAAESALGRAPGAPDLPPPPRRAFPRVAIILALAGAALAAGVVAFLGSRGPVVVPETAPAATVVSVKRDWPRSPELKRAVALIDGIETIPEDFRLAEEIATRWVEKNPADAEAITVLARVHSMWLLRGWDRSTARYQKAKNTAERALQLAPDEPEALLALAIHLFARGVEAQRALDLAQRAVDLAPEEPRFHRMRDNCLWVLHVSPGSVFNEFGEEPESEGLRLALASARRTVELFPRDALVRYELSRHYRNTGRYQDFERTLEETLALAPLGNALVWKARARFGFHGDLPGMKAVLDQVPVRVRGIERTVLGYFLYSAFTGRPDSGLEALNGFVEPWLIDFDFRGPRALLVAALLELGGKKELARVQYDLALAELLKYRSLSPDDNQTYLNEAWIQHALGRSEEARGALRTYSESIARPFSVSPLNTWWFQAIPATLLIGDRTTALALIREASTSRKYGRATIRSRLALDSRLVAFRDDPEIAALLAEPADSASALKSPPPAAASEATLLVTRAIAITDRVGFTREDLGVAEEVARRATEMEPDSALAWGARAWVQAAWLMRSWDLSEKRRQETQSLANRALALDPAQPDALYALSHVFSRQGALEQAEALLRKALVAAPDNLRFARTLGSILARRDRREEAVRHLEALAARFPRDPLVRYEIALLHVGYGFRDYNTADLDVAAGRLDEAIAIQPFASALILRAMIAGAWHDDLGTLRAKFAQLAELPLDERTEDRTIALTMWGHLLRGQYDQVAATGSLTSRSHFEDSTIVYKYKSWLLALARERQGKPNLARIDWQSSEAFLRQRNVESPGVAVLQLELAVTLARLGQRAEAESLVAKIEPAWREELSMQRAFKLAQFYASLGDAAKATDYLRPLLDRGFYSTRHVLRRDPWWDKIRDSAQFTALLEQLGPQP